MLAGVRDNVEELKQRVLKLEKMLSIVQQEKANLEDDFRHVLELHFARKPIAYGYNPEI